MQKKTFLKCDFPNSQSMIDQGQLESVHGDIETYKASISNPVDMYKNFVFGDLVKPVPRGFSVQDLKLFISYIS